jgi:peptide/nickel transport system substrate-binding protein
MNSVASYSYLGWNQVKEGKKTRFADKRVRQAMTYLTDRKRIIKDIFLGYAEVAISPFSPSSKQHDPALLAREFDIKKAETLLAEAGYQDRNGDGVIEDEQGVAFEFKLVYFQDNEDTKRMVLLLKDIYARAGIKLIPSPQEWPVMLDMIDKKNFDAITLAWTSGIETDIYQMFHGSQSKTNGDNFINFQNAKLDKVIDQARTLINEEERMKVWQQAEKIIVEEQPYTFLMRRKTLAFIDQRIKNIEVTKIGLNRGVLPFETYIPTALQKYKQ